MCLRWESWDVEYCKRETEESFLSLLSRTIYCYIREEQGSPRGSGRECETELSFHDRLPSSPLLVVNPASAEPKPRSALQVAD